METLVGAAGEGGGDPSDLAAECEGGVHVMGRKLCGVMKDEVPLHVARHPSQQGHLEGRTPGLSIS